jgi:ATP-dependent Lon protease
MTSALASLVTGRHVRADTAMTGEVTLAGNVLPIGGLKEKALAAQRAGIKRVLAPDRNEPDAEDFPGPLREDVDFIWVSDVEQVLGEALETRHPRRRSAGMLESRTS